MVSFTRMKEDLDELTTQVKLLILRFIFQNSFLTHSLYHQVETKLPGKTVLWLLVAICILIIFILGFGIGYGSGRNTDNISRQPFYYFISNNSESCPALNGGRLLTTVDEGQSFEGLSVHLQCEGNYTPFPLSVKCRRRPGGKELEWSHLPVCFPTILVTPEHWSKVPHARSVSCTGDSSKTTCSLNCIQNYAAVEEEKYT